MMKMKMINIVNVSFTVVGKSIVLRPACLRLFVLLRSPSFLFVRRYIRTIRLQKGNA